MAGLHIGIPCILKLGVVGGNGAVQLAQLKQQA